MPTMLLAVHIAIATTMTLVTLGVAIKAYGRQESRLYGAMLGTFGATVASGLGLLIVTPVSFGRFCVTMSVFMLGVVLVGAYYRARLAAI